MSRGKKKGTHSVRNALLMLLLLFLLFLLLPLLGQKGFAPFLDLRWRGGGKKVFFAKLWSPGGQIWSAWQTDNRLGSCKKKMAASRHIRHPLAPGTKDLPAPLFWRKWILFMARKKKPTRRRERRRRKNMINWRGSRSGRHNFRSSSSSSCYALRFPRKKRTKRKKRSGKVFTTIISWRRRRVKRERERERQNVFYLFASLSPQEKRTLRPDQYIAETSGQTWISKFMSAQPMLASPVGMLARGGDTGGS